MCGIVGYIGDKQALPIVIKGLERLEYRGYDSAGILIYDQRKKEVYFEKQPGRIKNLTRVIDPDTPGTLGIGHTRWATHGQVNKANAHPHYDCQKKIFVVHNGIIENFREIKSSLIQRGHKFSSETDTEVFPHLLEELIKEGLSYEQAIIQSLKKIRGSFAFLIFNKDYPDMIVAARLSSPLILGLGDKEFILASDQTAIGLITNKIVYLNDGDIVFVNKNKYEIKSFLSEDTKNYEGIIDFSSAETEKGRFQNYMIKEIFDEPKAVEDTLRGRLLIEEGDVKLGGLDRVASRLKEIDNILITGCGTAFYAAKLAEYFFEEYAQISTKAEIASELRYKMPVVSEKTLLISVSQSGETADTLAVIKNFKTKGILTIGITNVVGSSIARLVDAGIYSHAGPELAVASTKAFLAQTVDLILLMIYLARQRKINVGEAKEILTELDQIHKKIQETIVDNDQKADSLAEKYLFAKDFLYIGRKYNFPIALEGSLKLKEISYVHAEGLAAGEIKHGPIALIEEGFPTIIIAPQDSVYEKTISNLEEIKARKGKIIVITTKGNKSLEKLADDVIYIPETLELLSPLLSIVPLHLFAYYFAKKLGRDVDRPRNLAKSVTVE
ncbi:MAG: glutamine--fructose-6-phosphate transaminase (isomerizing) [Parcubacteria group bacterium CG_4_10_14_0_2_um_filter_7_35_8]|nr:MAG: glutamine--fructose-6-phosphate transaminase (isomerizing) [Parcubacteria group bacterium CG_4_10_14_0_2_um_filter_7_35_8]